MAKVQLSDLYNIATVKVPGDASWLSLFFNAMEEEFHRPADESQYSMLHNMLHIFLLQAERELKRQGFQELKPGIYLDYLLKFKELLEQEFREEKSVKIYASKLNLSQKQLHKATTTIMDKTPKQIINERILLEAKRLLIHSNQSVKEIAYELGYDEPTNFIKFFRKYIHTTPSLFRGQF